MVLMDGAMHLELQLPTPADIGWASLSGCTAISLLEPFGFANQVAAVGR